MSFSGRPEERLRKSMREEEEERRRKCKMKNGKRKEAKGSIEMNDDPVSKETILHGEGSIVRYRRRSLTPSNHQKSSGIFTGSLLILNKTSKTSEEIKWQRPWSLRNPEMSSTIQPNVKNPSRIFKDRHKCSQESLKIQKILSRIPAGSKKPLKSPRILKNPCRIP